MVGWHHRFKGHESEQTPGDGEGRGSLECCSPCVHPESDMTQGLNNSKTHRKRDQTVVTSHGDEGELEEGDQRWKLPVTRQINTRDVMYNMMTIVSTAVQYIGKQLVNPKRSYHKEKKFFLFILLFFSFYCIYMRRWILVEPIVVIILQYINQTIISSALNLYSDICQLFLNKAGKKFV